MESSRKVIIRKISRRQVQKQCQDLRQALTLDTHVAAKVAALVVVLFLIPIAFLNLPHLPQPEWLPFLVDLFAEGVMLFFALWLLLNLVGFSRFLSGHTWHQALNLLAKRVRDIPRIPAAFHLPPLNLETQQRQQVSVIWRWLRQIRRVRPPGTWSKSQTPILLFQQSSLLLAP